MTTFSFRAQTDRGLFQEGALLAESRRHALELLVAKGLRPLILAEVDARGAPQQVFVLRPERGETASLDAEEALSATPPAGPRLRPSPLAERLP